MRIGLLAVCLVIACPQSAAASTAADFPPAPADPLAGFITEGLMAQSFTAEVGGEFDRITLAVSRWSGSGQGDLVVQVRTVREDGAPSDTVLASTTVSAGDVPLSTSSGMPPVALYPGTSAEALFATPFSLTAGERYYVVVGAASYSLFGGSYAWHPADADYAGADATYRESYFPEGFWFPVGGVADRAMTVGSADQELWPFGGFERPVDDLPTVNRATAGQAIPVKFSLGGDRGLDIFAEGHPRSAEIPCGSTALVDGIEETVSPGAATLTYAAGDDRYQYVWKTSEAWAGQCRQLVVAFADGSVHRVNFSFR